jgi:hypothetical protein
MRYLVVLLMLSLAGPCGRSSLAQTTAVIERSPVLEQALVGRWVGVLEYRDYSEPAGSTKRVQLPTWLQIQSGTEGMTFVYTYDDGPNKVLEERDTVVFDLGTKTYHAMENGHPWESYAVAGLEALKDGRGELVLTGSGQENDKPAEMRTTWTIRRNLLTILEETRPAGSSASFVFRHRYVFTRAEAPSLTGQR